MQTQQGSTAARIALAAAVLTAMSSDSIGSAASPTPFPECTPDMNNVTDPQEIDAICDRFCDSKCAFNNDTAGDTGLPGIITVYRLTPWNVTGIDNKNTGDPPGDIMFYLMNKGVTTDQGHSSFLRVHDIFGQFQVQFDGAYGPYKQCNPVDSNADPLKPHSNFECEFDCMSPPHCPASSYTNGISHFGGLHCGCERANATVGRVDMGTAFGGHAGFRRRSLQSRPMHDFDEEAQEDAELEAIDYLVRQPFLDSRNGQKAGTAADPDPYWACSQRVADLCLPHHHMWPPAPPGQCEACASNHTDELKAAGCSSDDIAHACSGDFMRCGEAVAQECAGQTGATCAACAEAHTKVMKRNNCTANYLGYACSGHSYGGNIHVDIGGYWYSTQVDGECKGSAVPGDGSGCSWKVHKTLKYTEESCINARFDEAVVANRQPCFDACSQPLNKTGACYAECYEKSVMGDLTVDPPTPGMTKEQIITPWVTAFTEDDPTKGGCPRITPPTFPPPPPSTLEYHDTATADKDYRRSHVAGERDACAQHVSHAEAVCDFVGSDSDACDKAHQVRERACRHAAK